MKYINDSFINYEFINSLTPYIVNDLFDKCGTTFSGRYQLHCVKKYVTVLFLKSFLSSATLSHLST